EGAFATRVQPAELATQLHAALGHQARIERCVVVGCQVQVDRLQPVETVAAGQFDLRVQQARAPTVVDREHQPRDVQHRYLADPHGRLMGHADAFGGVDVDALGAQFPGAL